VSFDPSWFVTGILVVLLLGQQVYWSFIVFKLNDRIMARSYGEYTQAQKSLKTSSQPRQPRAAVADPIAEENAQRANSLLL